MNDRSRERERRKRHRSGPASPAWLERLLSRVAPHIMVEFDIDRDRWVVLTEDLDGQWRLLRILEDRDGNAAYPTIENTIEATRKLETARFQKPVDLDNYLDKIDEANAKILSSKRKPADDLMKDGLDRMGFELGLSRSYRARPLWLPS